MASCTRLFGVWCTEFSRNSAQRRYTERRKIHRLRHTENCWFAAEINAVKEMYLKHFKIVGFEKYQMRFSTSAP
ncbi:MAG: hypothetical protein EXS18_03470 [Verrucomicrobiae bacterium]|nr:hypothetical protein [Verrucomicrobiae bacterium]